MKTQHLKAQTRTVTGRAVKKLRREGVLPATVYGKNTKSVSVQANREDFESILSAAGESGVIEIELENTTHPVLTHSIQRHPVTSEILHVEFLQVNLKEKIQTTIPILLTGESPAVQDRRGMLLELSTTVEVEALPTDIPEHLEADISSLVEVGNEINIQHLMATSGVVVVTDSAQPIAKIAELVKPEKEPEPEETEGGEEQSVGEEGEEEKAEETEKEEQGEGEEGEKKNTKEEEKK